MDFNVWHGDPEGDGPPGGPGVLDSLIEAAGGAALPGKAGLAQAILGIWTTPQGGHRHLGTIKNVLNSIGAYRAYRRQADPSYGAAVAVDDVGVWMKANGFAEPEPGAFPLTLSFLIYKYTESLPQRVLLVGEKKRKIVVVSLPNGRTAAWAVRSSDYYGGEYPSSIYLDSGSVSGWLDGLADHIWAVEGGSLQIDMPANGRQGSSIFRLSSLPDAEDYVEPDGDSHRAGLTSTVDRIRAFQWAGLSRRVLFKGAPGTGKSTLIRRVSAQLGKGRRLRVGVAAFNESSQSVVQLLNLLRPDVLLLDDIDRADGDMTGLLHGLEDLHLVVLATTNTTSRIDPALLRPGRFDEIVEVPAPGGDWRRRILSHYLTAGGSFIADDELLDHVADVTVGFPQAALRELANTLRVVGVEHLDAEVARLRLHNDLCDGEAMERYMSPEVRRIPRSAAVAGR